MSTKRGSKSARKSKMSTRRGKMSTHRLNIDFPADDYTYLKMLC